MSNFANAHHFSIDGGNFTAIQEQNIYNSSPGK